MYVQDGLDSTLYPLLVPRYLEATNATNFQKHIERYGLPYGVLGVISHLLTFYVIGCHLYGRRPLAPWMAMTKERWNLFITVVSSIVSITLACVTLARTRGNKPLMTFAGMHIALAALLDIIALHRLLASQKSNDNWINLWVFPIIAVSILSVYAFYEFEFSTDDGKARGLIESAGIIVIVVWVGLTGLATFFTLIAWTCSGFKAPFVFSLTALVFSCALFWFADTGAAIVTKNSLGRPSNAVKALYWTYWVFERVPLLSV